MSTHNHFFLEKLEKKSKLNPGLILPGCACKNISDRQFYTFVLSITENLKHFHNSFVSDEISFGCS